MTADGWTLGLQRIPGRQNESTAYTAPKPYHKQPVILWHGLSLSSEVFVCHVQPSMNLAFVLADSGFDVWLANTRGNKYSTNHATFKKGTPEYWNFGIDEMARYDVVSVVDYVLDQTGHERCVYIGYSQGSAIAFAALSLCTDLNHKISAFVGVAPVVYPEKFHIPIVSSLASKLRPSVFFKMLGSNEFLPIAHFLKRVLSPDAYATIIAKALEFLFGWKCNSFGNVNRKTCLFSHIISNTSIKTYIHWFQVMQDSCLNSFRDNHHQYPLLFDVINFPHTKAVSRIDTHKYPTKLITTKIFLFCGGLDPMSNYPEIGLNLPEHAKIDCIEGYSHIDLIWSENAQKDFWNTLVDAIKSE